MKWTDYTTKETLKDNDELMILDKDANANKRTLMDKIWDYVVDKMTTAVIAKLGTTNKTLIGAVNELNSNAIVFGNTITTGNVNLNGGLFSTKNAVCINTIATNDINSIIGMPIDAYSYGRLITITTNLKYACVQFYIPHLGACIYIRAMADPKSDVNNTSWRTINCPPSRESVKPS